MQKVLFVVGFALLIAVSCLFYLAWTGHPMMSQLSFESGPRGEVIPNKEVRGLFKVVQSDDPDFRKDYLFVSFDGNLYTLTKRQVKYAPSYEGNATYLGEVRRDEGLILNNFFHAEIVEPDADDDELQRLLTMNKLMGDLAEPLNAAGIEVQLHLDAAMVGFSKVQLEQVEYLANNPEALVKYMQALGSSSFVVSDEFYGLDEVAEHLVLGRDITETGSELSDLIETLRAGFSGNEL